MVTRRKWNAQTGRYEVVGQTILDDSWKPGGTAAAATSTTVPAKPAKGPQGPVVKPAQGPVAPSTTVAPATTVAKKIQPQKTTTTTAPAAAKQKAAVKPTVTTQRDVYTKSNIKGGRGKSPGMTAEAYNTNVLMDALNRTKPEGMSDAQWALLIQSLNQGSTGGGGGGGASAAQQGLAGWIGGMQAAKMQEAAGAEAQQMYGQMAGTNYAEALNQIATRYAPQIEALNKYYTGQESDALKSITAATQEAQQNLANPTAYQDLQAALLSAPQQALNIGAYGASGDLAAAQQASDAETARFVSDLLSRGYKQTQAVNTDYFTALKNAVTGSESQAKGQLATTLAGLKAADLGNIRSSQQTDVGNAEAVRNQLIQAGIEALMSGKQTAAQTRASTAASYGAYKPKSKKNKKK